MKLHIHIHHHGDSAISAKLDRIIAQNSQIINQNNKIMTDLTVLTQEVAENQDTIQSAITLLNGLKQALDAAGTDPVALKALSDSLSANTDSLAAAVVANTPASEEPPVDPNA